MVMVTRNIEGIKILDATIRDGGLVNDFFFTDDFVKKVYDANIAAGLDYMEFGYRADKKMFEPSKFGKWKFASDEDIRSIVGDNPTSLKLSIMAIFVTISTRNRKALLIWYVWLPTLRPYPKQSR